MSDAGRVRSEPGSRACPHQPEYGGGARSIRRLAAVGLLAGGGGLGPRGLLFFTGGQADRDPPGGGAGDAERGVAAGVRMLAAAAAARLGPEQRLEREQAGGR